VPEPRDLKEFLSWEPPPLQAVISDGLLFQGSKGVLYGRYKSLKSMLAIYLALAVSKGETWLDFTTPIMGASVLYLQLELPEPMLQSRIKKMLQGAEETKQKVWVWSEYSLKLDNEGGWNRLYNYVDAMRPELLIIDPIYKVMQGNILDWRSVQDLLDGIDKLLGHFPSMAVVLVSHTRKQGDTEARGSDDMIGSSVISAWADSIIKVERKSWGDITVSFDIVRHATKELAPRHFSFDENTMQFLPKLTLGSPN